MTASVVTPFALLGGVFYAARTPTSRDRHSPGSTPSTTSVDVTRSVIAGFGESPVGISLAVAALAAVATSRCVVGCVGNVDDEPTLA
jgi:hypothetical protein